MKQMISLALAFVLLLTGFNAFAETTDVQSIKIELKSTVMRPGETQRMVVSVTPSTTTPVLEYESDNPDVVTAAIGTLIANAEGVANIIVRVSGTQIYDSVTVTVSDKITDDDKPESDDTGDAEDENQNSESIKVNKINVENKTLYLTRYETERIAYSVSPDNASDTKVLFKSSNTSVVTVDDDGYVYAKKKGNATVTLESDDGGAKATVKVYVSDDYEDEDYDSSLRNIYITYEDEIVKNKFEVMETETLQLGIKSSPSSASKKVSWRSSNKRVATVDNNGKVTGVKKGTCTIYAASTVNSSKRDSITVVVTDYVRYPDKIAVTPQDNAIFETGNTFFLFATLYPEDTTETDITWKVDRGAVINKNGQLTVTDAGEITVRAYSPDRKTVGEYKFNAVYSEGHFTTIGGAYNLTNDRGIEMFFNTDVSAYSAMNDIFAACDASGNGDKIGLSVKTDGRKLTVSPGESWPEGDVYIFIKGTLSDTKGNTLGKNLKYKLNIRGNVNVK